MKITEHTTPREACRYATNTLRRRWSEAEIIILKDAEAAYFYARDVIKGRWPEAEPTIMQNAQAARSYANNILRRRWPEAEPTIMQDAMVVFDYARYIIKDRWIEAEYLISQNDYASRAYLEVFFPNTEVVTKEQIDDYRWAKAGAIGYFAPKELFKYKPCSLLDTLLEESPQEAII